MKALLQKLGDKETAKLVDKIIFVAVPQIGTPAAMAGLLHGESQGIFPALSTKNARGFGENMSSAYNLLPSEEYFSTVQTPVASFDISSKSELNNLYPDEINSYDKLYDFIADDFHKVSATCSEVDIPAKLSLSLLQKSKDLHEDLDNWNAPEGIKVIQIAGWGVTKTLSKTEYEDTEGSYCDEGVCVNGIDVLKPDFKFTIDGDGTVVTPSALRMSGGERYFVDLKKYNTNHSFFILSGFLSLNHGNILEIPELNSFIADNILNEEKKISQYKYISTEVPLLSDKKRLQYSLHSPLTLGLYDSEGHHTGINSDGQIEEQIPGTYYQQFGDKKYIFADEDISSRIEMRGYDDGKFTFKVEEFIGDESINEITFKDMPTTSQTIVNFEIPGELESASDLKIDEDGDDNNDYSIEPIINQEVTFSADTISPQIEIIHPENKEYKKDEVIEILLDISDNVSSADKIVVNKFLDGNIFNQGNIDSALLKTGKYTLSVEVVDEAGNKTQKQVEFDLFTNTNILRKNISHFYDLKLIKSRQEKNILDNALIFIQREINFYYSIKNSFFLRNKTKEKILKVLEKKIQTHLNTIEKRIIQDKKNYVTIVKEIIVSDLEFIKNNI
jgi:hypothetical protein